MWAKDPSVRMKINPWTSCFTTRLSFTLPSTNMQITLGHVTDLLSKYHGTLILLVVVLIVVARRWTAVLCSVAGQVGACYSTADLAKSQQCTGT